MRKLRHRDIKFLAQRPTSRDQKSLPSVQIAMRPGIHDPCCILLQGESLEGYKIHSVILKEGSGHHIPAAAPLERLHLQSPGSRAQLLLVVSGVRAASARRMSRKKVSCFLPGWEQGEPSMDAPWAPNPSDNDPTRPRKSEAPWGGSKAERMPRARGFPASQIETNPSSQSLPRDLSSPWAKEPYGL